MFQRLSINGFEKSSTAVTSTNELPVECELKLQPGHENNGAADEMMGIDQPGEIIDEQPLSSNENMELDHKQVG